jgi:hypothetical protein
MVLLIRSGDLLSPFLVFAVHIAGLGLLTSERRFDRIRQRQARRELRNEQAP